MFFSFYFLDFFGSNFFVIIPKPKTVYIIPTKAPTNGIIVNSHITREVANNIPIFGHVLDIFNLVHIMLFSAIVNTGILKSNNTIYVKDTKEKVIGAITPEQWMRDKYFNIVGTDIRFVIQNGMIRFLNPPAAGLSVVFQYRSNTVVYDAKTLEEKPQLTKNTDIPVFDEYLVKLAVEWIWLKRNGMDYAEEFNEFEREIKKRYGAGLATKDINLSGAVFDPADTGVFINAATSDKQK